MSSKPLAFKLEKKSILSRSQERCSEKSAWSSVQTFLIFWVDWVVVSESVMVKEGNEVLSLEMWAECGTLTGPQHRLKACNSFEWRFCLRTTFLLSYLWLMPLTNTFPCCSWQRAARRTLPRLYRLNCILLPASPLLPQGTTTYISQSEGNGFDFLPLFTHQIGKEKDECVSDLTVLDKHTRATECACMCTVLKCVFGGAGEFISSCHSSTSLVDFMGKVNTS